MPLCFTGPSKDLTQGACTEHQCWRGCDWLPVLQTAVIPLGLVYSPTTRNVDSQARRYRTYGRTGSRCYGTSPCLGSSSPSGYMAPALPRHQGRGEGSYPGSVPSVAPHMHMHPELQFIPRGPPVNATRHPAPLPTHMAYTAAMQLTSALRHAIKSHPSNLPQSHTRGPPRSH